MEETRYGQEGERSLSTSLDVPKGNAVGLETVEKHISAYITYITQN